MVSALVGYSSISVEAAKNIVSNRYLDCESSNVIFINRGFNDTYLVKDENSKQILRIYNHAWRTKEQISTELELLSDLHLNQVSVSYPLFDREKSLIQSIQAPEGTRYATMFSFARGNSITQLTEVESEAIGIEVGKFHNVTQDKRSLHLPCNYSVEEVIKNSLKTIKHFITSFYCLSDCKVQWEELEEIGNKLAKKFSSISPEQLSFGTCHGDIHLGNLFYTHDNKVTLFDFDYIGYGCLLYDLGVTLWFDEEFREKHNAEAFIAGYQKERSLSTLEISLIPYFSAIRHLFQITTFCKILDGTNHPLMTLPSIINNISNLKAWVEERCDLS